MTLDLAQHPRSWACHVGSARGTPIRRAKFPDKRFTVENADIFWAGALIHRVNYLGADGGRAYLPLGGGNDGLDVTRLDVAVAGVIDNLEGGSRFGPYVDGVPYRFQD
jgi:hypothetical protein